MAAPYAPHAAIDRVTDLGITTAWPILGVVGLRTPGRRGTGRAGPDADGHAPPADAPVTDTQPVDVAK